MLSKILTLIFALNLLIFETICVEKFDDDLLISSNNLNDLLKRDDFDKNYRIIETNFGPDGEKDFKDGHIPRAIYVDATFNSTSTQYIKYTIPNAKALGDYLGSLGISDHHRLIIYDRSDYGFSASSRLWYLLELFGNETVTILNGGLNDWKANQFSLTTESSTYREQLYEAIFQPKLLRLYEEVVEVIKTGEEVLVDARDRPVYDQDHIPTALNVPYSEIFDQKTGLLKSKEILLEMVLSQGIDLKRTLVTYCQTGVRASSLKFVLNLLGARLVAVYNGSWFEYSQRSKL
ncbi:unnamed protein product [Brachionus calyciflorus]|uniref:Rhodanese domain-containing protein n=1 Tax=Brachionus calyciflorus TaxID=104777 RepID=A0A814DB73_9BILA|nr:unnamed protein product [Brachionus calyciflorus]